MSTQNRVPRSIAFRCSAAILAALQVFAITPAPVLAQPPGQSDDKDNLRPYLRHLPARPRRNHRQPPLQRHRQRQRHARSEVRPRGPELRPGHGRRPLPGQPYRQVALSDTARPARRRPEDSLHLLTRRRRGSRERPAQHAVLHLPHHRRHRPRLRRSRHPRPQRQQSPQRPLPTHPRGSLRRLRCQPRPPLLSDVAAARLQRPLLHQVEPQWLPR